MRPTEYVQNWIKRADEDLDAAELLLGKGGSSNPACFHAQQAAEKYLKGFLAHHERHVRKIHDLGALLRNCIVVDNDFENLHDDIIYLDRFYAKTRYPDDYVEFLREDAEKALAAVLRVKEFVLAKLQSTKQTNGFGTLGVLAVIAAALVLVGGGFFAYQRFTRVPGPSVPQETSTQSPQSRIVPEEIFVRLDSRADRNILESIIAGYGGSVVADKATEDGGAGLRIKFPGATEQRLEQISKEIADRVSGVLSVSPHWIPGPIYNSSEVDASQWKTYRNEKYGFEVRYPSSWCHNDPKKDEGFVNFSRCPYADNTSVMKLDSLCVFATGFEYAEKFATTTEEVRFNNNVFLENKTYADDEWVLDIISVNMPSSDDKQCKMISFIFGKNSIKDFRVGIVPQILSTFKFVK